ncbi:MAG: thioredoxin family protein [Calditrichia bacterium]
MKFFTFFFLVVIALGLVYPGSAQEGQQTFTVKKSDSKTILIGQLTPRDIWDHLPEWYADFMIYQPDSHIVAQLADIQEDFRILCVLGTWCSDSRDGVPPFLKSIAEANNPHLQVELYGVGRENRDSLSIYLTYKIERVPTFVILYENQEIGRMVETPEETFAADLLKLITQRRAHEK